MARPHVDYHAVLLSAFNLLEKLFLWAGYKTRNLRNYSGFITDANQWSSIGVDNLPECRRIRMKILVHKQCRLNMSISQQERCIWPLNVMGSLRYAMSSP